MSKTAREIVSQLPKKRRERIARRSQQLVAEELALQELRKAMQLTQKSVAKKLDIGQDAVSRLEQRSDLMLSTLRKYVEALGGRLEIRAEFPDRPPVVVTGLGDLASSRDNGGKTVRARARR